MNKVLSTALITIGSLGVLAGISGAVYGLAKHGDELRQKIRGDEETSVSRSSSSNSSATSSSASPSQSEPEEDPYVNPDLYRGSYPTSVPSNVIRQSAYNDPSQDLGIGVKLSRHKFWKESYAGLVQIPFTIKTTGWSYYNNAIVSYSVVGKDGLVLPDATVVCQKARGISYYASYVTTRGQTGVLNYGGDEYVLKLTGIGMDEAYELELRATIVQGDKTVTASQRFTVYGQSSEDPYLGPAADTLGLRQVDGSTDLVVIQEDGQQGKDVDFYVTAPFADSCRLIQVAVYMPNNSYNLASNVTLSTEDGEQGENDNGGTCEQIVNVRHGAKVTLHTPAVARSKVQRFTIKVSYFDDNRSSDNKLFGTVDQAMRVCGPTLSEPMLGLSLSNYTRATSEYAVTPLDIPVYIPASWPEGTNETYLEISWPEEYNGAMGGFIELPGYETVRSEIGANKIRAYGLYGDKVYKFTPNYIDPNIVVPLTVSIVGPTRTDWSFNYSGGNHATRRIYNASQGIERVKVYNDKANSFEFEYYYPNNESGERKLTVATVHKPSEDAPDIQLECDGVVTSEENNYSLEISENATPFRLIAPAVKKGQFYHYTISDARANGTGSPVVYQCFVVHPSEEDMARYSFASEDDKTFEIEEGESATIPICLATEKHGQGECLPILKVEELTPSAETPTFSLTASGRTVTNYRTNEWKLINPTAIWSYGAVYVNASGLSEGMHRIKMTLWFQYRSDFKVESYAYVKVNAATTE